MWHYSEEEVENRSPSCETFTKIITYTIKSCNIKVYHTHFHFYPFLIKSAKLLKRVNETEIFKEHHHAWVSLSLSLSLSLHSLAKFEVSEKHVILSLPLFLSLSFLPWPWKAPSTLLPNFVFFIFLHILIHFSHSFLFFLLLFHLHAHAFAPHVNFNVSIYIPFNIPSIVFLFFNAPPTQLVQQLLFINHVPNAKHINQRYLL